jgi:hypothetical protein
VAIWAEARDIDFFYIIYRIGDIGDERFRATSGLEKAL